MTKQEIIKYSILGVIAIAAIILVISLLTSYRDKGDDSYKELIRAKDETIQAVARERDTYRQWKDDAIQELQTKDSLLQIKVKTNTVRYEKIPVTVGNYSDDELRRAVEEYR